MAANSPLPSPPPTAPSSPPGVRSGTCPHSVNRHIVERKGKGRMKRWKNTLWKRKKLPCLNRLNYASNTCQKECSENAPKQLLLTATNVSAALCYWLVNSTDAFKFHIKYWLKPSPKDGWGESTWATWGSHKKPQASAKGNHNSLVKEGTVTLRRVS